MLSLFPTEKVLSQSDDNSITLTSHRILYQYKDWGRSYNQNIMLEHITSTENQYTSKITLLFISAFFLITGVAGLVNGADTVAVAGILAGAFFIWLYRSTKKNVIVIASPSTRMIINVAGMHNDQILNFINKVEGAKNNRIVELGARSGY